MPNEYYKVENVTVTVEWVQQVGALLYNARILPMDQAEAPVENDVCPDMASK